MERSVRSKGMEFGCNCRFGLEVPVKCIAIQGAMDKQPSSLDRTWPESRHSNATRPILLRSYDPTLRKFERIPQYLQALPPLCAMNFAL